MLCLLASCPAARRPHLALRDAGCAPGSPPPTPASASRIVSTTPTDLNVFTYRNYYNGGGVALGDLTGDGLPEIVLTSNLAAPGFT